MGLGGSWLFCYPPGAVEAGKLQFEGEMWAGLQLKVRCGLENAAKGEMWARKCSQLATSRASCGQRPLATGSNQCIH